MRPILKFKYDDGEGYMYLMLTTEGILEIEDHDGEGEVIFTADLLPDEVKKLKDYLNEYVK